MMTQDQLREEIARTRAELGDTLQALAERADVPSRVRARVADTRQRVRRAARTPAPWLVLAAAGGAAALVAVLVILGRRR